MIKKAVLPVAGFGTRFLPASKATPKEMLPIIDKPLVQYAVEEAINIKSIFLSLKALEASLMFSHLNFLEALSESS